MVTPQRDRPCASLSGRKAGPVRCSGRTLGFDMSGDDEPSPFPFAVSGVMQRRQQLLAQMAGLDAERRVILRQIEALEVSLRVLDPGVSIPDEKALLRWRGPDPVEMSGLTQSVLRALRLAGGPLTTAEVTQVVIKDRGRDPADRPFYTVVRQRVGVCLRKLNLRKIVRRAEEGSRTPLWLINDI